MAPNPNLQGLHDAGTSIWLDTLSRELLDSGQFSELIRDYAVTGATSNPTIFAKAITGSDRYDAQLRALADAGERDPQELFFAIALDDVREAAHELRARLRPKRRPRRIRLVRVHARSRRRHSGDDRPGERALAATERAQRDDQGPGNRGGTAGDRGAHAARRQRQRHAAVRDRALRAGDRRVPARTERTRRRRRAARFDRIGRIVLRLSDRHQGRRAAARALAAARVAWRSPTPASPTSAT